MKMAGSKVKAAKKRPRHWPAPGMPPDPPELPLPCPPGFVAVAEAIHHQTALVRFELAAVVDHLAQLLAHLKEQVRHDQVADLRGLVATELADVRIELERWGNAAAAGDRALRERIERLEDTKK